MTAALDGRRGRMRADGQHFEARIEKRIPVAAGLGGGSSDAAAALRLANDLLDVPLERRGAPRARGSARRGRPVLSRNGPQLGNRGRHDAGPLALPRDYVVLLALPEGVAKSSTSVVYGAFDARRGEEGYPERRPRSSGRSSELRGPTDLARLPRTTSRPRRSRTSSGRPERSVPT